jgi:hypothetical protein
MAVRRQPRSRVSPTEGLAHPTAKQRSRTDIPANPTAHRDPERKALRTRRPEGKNEQTNPCNATLSTRCTRGPSRTACASSRCARSRASFPPRRSAILDGFVPALTDRRDRGAGARAPASPGREHAHPVRRREHASVRRALPQRSDRRARRDAAPRDPGAIGVSARAR